MRSTKTATMTLLLCLPAALAASAEPGNNPLLGDWDTPFGVPPFERIRPEHFLPAFQAGMEEQRGEIGSITRSTEPPSFANTVEALERSGALLRRVDSVFNVITDALTSDEVQKIAKEVAPLQSRHQDDILLDEALFRRFQAVYERRAALVLDAEQTMLLEETYRDFVRGGANLDPAAKARLREINQELSVLTVAYGENVLKENNRFELVIESEDDLAGLPKSVVSAAAETAAERGHPGKWAFTLHKPSLIPFLQYSVRRELRERMLRAYITRADHDDELDNKRNAARIATLRLERARLLGYESHAAFVLERNMAQTPQQVYGFLDQVWKAALPVARREVSEMQALIDREGGGFQLAAWDWWYYAEKQRKEKYDLDEEELRPYFELDRVREGAFGVCQKLYGIRFVERTDVPKYHQDVKVFEVVEQDGSHVGLFYVDYFPRESKNGGAWMSSFRKEARLAGQRISPIIYNVGNFSKPTADQPALLSLEEVETLFHELGHALHGLLSDATYESLSGTAVPRDFVELPSQIMENWAKHPDVLRSYARHYATGEPIPEALVSKLEKSARFNQGFATVEYLAASYLDMDWHSLRGSVPTDVNGFEKQALDRIGLIPEIITRYRSTYFTHIFSGGYPAGYYSYLWAEVLDADAFQAFKETSLFDPATATRFRREILARGHTEDPMVLYKRFRGREPGIEPLLEKRGLKGDGTGTD
jgi:peptidyl-dipeptidase Dcp